MYLVDIVMRMPRQLPRACKSLNYKSQQPIFLVLRKVKFPSQTSISEASAFTIGDTDGTLYFYTFNNCSLYRIEFYIRIVIYSYDITTRIGKGHHKN